HRPHDGSAARWGRSEIARTGGIARDRPARGGPAELVDGQRRSRPVAGPAELVALPDSVVAGRRRGGARGQVQDRASAARARRTEGPGQVRVEVDGRPAGDLRPPGIADKGRIPLTFTQRFSTPGSHLVTISIDEDAMRGDNQQDFAVEVMPTLPVLIVDGDVRNSRTRGADFLRDALAPALDTAPSFLLRILSIAEFTPDLLTKPIGRE